MDENFIKLVEEFEVLQSKGLLLLVKYEENTITFQDLLDHVKSLQKVQGQIDNMMILSATRFYGKCKVARQNKNIKELGFGVEP